MWVGKKIMTHGKKNYVHCEKKIMIIKTENYEDEKEN